MKNKHIVIDEETGGLDEFSNPITEMAWQVINHETLNLEEKGSTFVKPYNDFKIDPIALQRSQVTMTQINSGIDYKTLVKNLIGVFDRATIKAGKIKYLPVLVGHNVGFDIRFLEVLFVLVNKDLYDYVEKVALDTQKEQQRLEGIPKNKKDKVKYRLVDCCERLGIRLKNAHGAANDVEATTLLFISQTNIFRSGAGTGGKMQGNSEKTKSVSVRQTFEM